MFLIRDEHHGWLRFSDPVDEISTSKVSEVKDALRHVDDGLEAGLTAVGFLSYEAAPGLDSALTARPPGELPLMWWGLFRTASALSELEVAGLAEGAAAPGSRGPWAPHLSRSHYVRVLQEIRDGIEDGDVYQVNSTFPCQVGEGARPPSAEALFFQLCQTQGDHLGALIQPPGENWEVVSASPELFFRLDGQQIETRPMKGTAQRHTDPAIDRANAESLQASEKDRAENLMIVDMMRNDLGKIAAPGSVHVPALWEIETYPTLHQMTSTVRAETSAPLSEILAALFPCASITGAPKSTAMRAIAKLEPQPRGPYTGCVGYLTPERQGQFNVAIRTAWRAKRDRPFLYGTGSGIVWDSTPRSEYLECQTKALVALDAHLAPTLLESVLYRKSYRASGGFPRLEAHVQRLRRSADAFGVEFSDQDVRDGLERERLELRARAVRLAKVRLLVGETSDSNAAGALSASVVVESDPIESTRGPVRLALATSPVWSGDLWLRHKTTQRHVYEDALARANELEPCDDVLLFNERGELTETSRANVILNIEGAWLTPKVSSGLLPGVFRQKLLDKGWARERVLHVKDLEKADRLLLVNSVRGFLEVDWVDGPKSTLHVQTSEERDAQT